jgi:hypothetical protein
MTTRLFLLPDISLNDPITHNIESQAIRAMRIPENLGPMVEFIGKSITCSNILVHLRESSEHLESFGAEEEERVFMYSEKQRLPLLGEHTSASSPLEVKPVMLSKEPKILLLHGQACSDWKADD